MYLLFFLTSITTSASPHIFDHAVKNYVTHISNQSPEKAKFAELITRAANVIKEIEKEDNEIEEKNNPDNKDNTDVECDEKTFDELRLICPKKGAPFLEKINPKTAAGMAYLIKLFTNPTSNQKTLQKRQTLIKFFIENPDIVEKIEHLLHNITNEESTLIEPYKKYSLIDTSKIILSFLFGFSIVITNFLKIKYTEPAIYKARITSLKESLKDIFSNLFPPFKSSQDIASFEYAAKLLTFENKNYNKDILQNLTYAGKIFLFMGSTFLIGKTFLVLYDLKENITNAFIENPLITYLIETIKLAQRIKNQESFLKITQIVNNVQPYISHKFNSLKNNQNKACLKTMLDLNKSLVNSQNFYIDEQGNLTQITQNYFKEKQISTLLHSHNSFLKNLYCDVGFLDAYSALAQFYKKHNGQFAQYNNALYPTIEIKGVIHPNVTDTTQAIANDFVHTASFEKRVIVCSGQNGSGKSFNTKTIFLAAWLAQTIGFTLTEKPIIMTPFSLFKIHANIADSDYYSKFETEKNELARLFEKITHLQKNNKKCLVLLDEPLSSTSSTIAEPILNAFIAMLNTNKKTLSFIITHLHPILANTNARQISIKVTKNKNGTLSSTRKFQEGPSYDNDAKDMIAQALHPTLQSLFLNNYETALQKMKDLKKSFETSTNANNSI